MYFTEEGAEYSHCTTVQCSVISPYRSSQALLLREMNMDIALPAVINLSRFEENLYHNWVEVRNSSDLMWTDTKVGDSHDAAMPIVYSVYDEELCYGVGQAV